jgi:predicted nucleic acid-binding protein
MPQTMPVMVDTSVWIALFRGEPIAEVQRLKALLAANITLLLGDLILTEILQGVRIARELQQVEVAFQAYPVMTLVGEGNARQSASYYRQLRQQGITVRKTIDCLIATWCIANQVALLHADQDFRPFVRFGLVEA